MQLNRYCQAQTSEFYTCSIPRSINLLTFVLIIYDCSIQLEFDQTNYRHVSEQLLKIGSDKSIFYTNLILIGFCEITTGTLKDFFWNQNASSRGYYKNFHFHFILFFNVCCNMEPSWSAGSRTHGPLYKVRLPKSVEKVKRRKSTRMQMVQMSYLYIPKTKNQETKTYTLLCCNASRASSYKRLRGWVFGRVGR